MRLQRVLETVLYYDSGREDELARFYEDVLGLPRIGDGLTFRIGPGVLLLFDHGRSTVQSTPPPHGAAGSIHACFVAAAEEYGDWKRRVEAEVPILEEREWPGGVRSFYFQDPAGNLLEIADGDLWPRA